MEGVLEASDDLYFPQNSSRFPEIEDIRQRMGKAWGLGLSLIHISPDRIARMYEEIYGGMEEDAATHLSRTFTVDSSEMVVEKDITDVYKRQQRAYNEINEFEKELKDWGAVIIKFWVQIDKDTQLARFQERQNNPEKQWKITDEDWRNREKWDEYEVAVNEMLQKTNTEYAPWHILESVDKKYARIKALKIVIEEIKKYV